MSSTSIPIVHADDVLPQIVSFAPQKRAFVFHNAKSKPVETMFVGTMITIPAVNVVDTRRFLDGRSYAETDADGDPIPGTRIIEDIFTFVPELGDEILTFDAAKAVAHILGVRKDPRADVSAAVASSKFALGGLSLLPRHPSKEIWMAVAREGEKRAFVASVESAQYLIDSIDQKNAKRREAGMEPASGGRDYDRAKFLVDQYNALTRREVEEFVAPHHGPAIEEDLELEAHVKAKAMELAERVTVGKDIDKLALAQELLSDPKIRKKLEKTYKIRKRGHVAAEQEELDKAIEEGRKLAEDEAETEVE